MKQKIIFDIAQDPDGYPPFHVESVWAQSTVTPSQYVIDNIPFFAREATIGDIVEVARTSRGLVYTKTISRSANSLIRVSVFEEGMMPEIRAMLHRLGCSTEELKDRPLIAVSVPPTASLNEVEAYLKDLLDAEVADYEEPILRQ